MRHMPHDADARATAAGWPALAEELEHWGEAGRVATLWWRDDDAATASPQLDRLLALACDVPVALAVIPALADDGLAASLASRPAVAVLQHGWRHTDHAGGQLGGRRKSEFPAERPVAAAAGDLAAGRTRLAALFGAAALAVLAPPWNRFDSRFLPLLAACGIGAVSQAGPRRLAWPIPGLFAANVHVDLVDWGGGRGFVGEAAALDGLVGHLRGRRLGRFDGAEPTGIMTHHAVQEGVAELFLGRLFAATRGHPAARWLAAGEVFAPGIASGNAPWNALGITGSA
jgi:hypothetical protein